MPLKTLPIGIGANLNIDQTTAGDNLAVAYINMYQDSAGATRTIPGNQLVDDMDTGLRTFNYYSDLNSARYIVSGGRIWVQSTFNGIIIEITGGALATNIKPTFAEDNAHLFVAADSKIFRIDGFTMTELGGNSPDHVTSLLYIGGFLLANGPDIPGDTVYSDDVAHGYETWEVYNNESDPDRLQSLLLVDSQYIYNLGPNTVEVTFLGGNPSNPFEINRGRLSSIGCIAKYSPVYDGSKVYYITQAGNSRKIVENTNGVSKTISFAIDPPLDRFERVDDAEGFMLTFRGQNFYCLHFPSANCEIIEQQWAGITLAFHLQTNTWIILAKWNDDNSQWIAWRGGDFCFIEPWNVRLIGDLTTGKTYQLYEDTTIDYVNAPQFQHRWRNDNSKTWGNYRTINLGVEGDYLRPADQYQCGAYRNRQHEFVYSDHTDAGEIFRALVLTGNINHQSETTKRSTFYRYNCKRGTNEFVLNSVSEQFDYLPR